MGGGGAMTWLLSTRIGRALAAVGALVIAVFSAFHLGRSQGRSVERSEAIEADHENADDIRDLVRTDLPERMHRYKDTGFRD